MKRLLNPFAILTAAFLCVVPCCTATAAAQSAAPASVSPDAAESEPTPGEIETVEIPGPMRSFLRMAGISQEVGPADVLPLLSRNVVIQGYQEGRPTEFLLLVMRYVTYARELEILTDGKGVIRLAGCDQAQLLVHALGYRIEHACGDPTAYLATSSPERAFLTLDSGFPVTSLEDAIRKGSAFSYQFPSTRVPVLFREHDWMSVSSWRRKQGDDMVDVILHDPNVARLYWAMSKIDPETQSSLRHSPGLKTLLPMASALEFYGTQLRIRSGRVLVPGGPDAAKNWEDLVGANPASPGSFVRKLLSEDDGWRAAWFDALSHVSASQQAHLTQGDRLKFLFKVYRAGAPNMSATRGIFPSNGNLMILLHELRWQPDGQIYLPGNLSLWRDVLLERTEAKLVRDWVKRVKTWDTPDQMLGTLVALSHYESETGPLQLYLMLNAIDRERAGSPRLSDGTVRLLATKFPLFHAWYPIFAEFPSLNDACIGQFIAAAEGLGGISDAPLRSNAIGSFQAEIGIWEILARQQQIPANKLAQSWQQTVEPFEKVSSSTQLFESARKSLQSMVLVASGSNSISEDEVVDLMAGPPQESTAGQQVHQMLAARLRSVLDDQRLVSLDTLFGLYDGLDEMAHGAAMSDSLIPLAGALREFEMPRPIFTNSERIAWSPLIYTNRHAELQVRTDLTRVIRDHGSPAQLESARGQLAPFLRDTLVGLNYAYYEPPGAQVLHHNPLFVRSHDFVAESVQGISDIWDTPELMGIGVTAGGGAYMIRSLAGLPYALASAEENFIAPANVQALIWEDVVPMLLVDAVEPRWWDVTPAEMHAAALYQRSGEEIVRLAGKDEGVRADVIKVLADHASSKRLETIETGLQTPASADALVPQLLPSELFYLAAQLRTDRPTEISSWGPASKELDALVRQNPSETGVERLSRDFGVPHPILDQTDLCNLISTKPFPALSGDASRLFGESWQSNNLFWARQADEMGYSPVMLNVLIPALTRRMVANIFATDIEDRAALLRALKVTGEEFRRGQIAVHVPAPTAPHQESSGW